MNSTAILQGKDSIDVLPYYKNFELLDKNQILKIFLNDAASFGKYMCKAENHYADIEKHFEVFRHGIFFSFFHLFSYFKVDIKVVLYNNITLEFSNP